MDTTEHDLKLLSIGFFIQGGIATFYGLLAACYIGFVGAILTFIAKSAPADPRNQIPPGLLALIGGVATGIVFLALAGGLCLLYSGVALRRHRHRTFVLVMAALSLLMFPYGTVLGVFTFMVLQRPAARLLFGEPPALPPPLPLS